MEVEDLPGTIRLITNTDPDAQTHEYVALAPQPSDSPNDPLNWSSWRKYWHTFLVLFIVGFTAATSNDEGSAQYGMNSQLGISWAAMDTAAGILFIAIGYATLLLAPAPFLYGRKIVYIICLLWSLIGAIWLARTETMPDSLWNQLFVGASESCAEATAQLSLSDIFFQNQRGLSMGLYVFATSVGTYLGPILAGFIADDVGWRWIGWIAVIITLVTLLVFYFTFEETYFDRHTLLCLGIQLERQSPSTANVDGGNETTDKDLKNALPVPERQLTNVESLTNEKPKSYFQRIALITPAHNLRGTGFKQYLKNLWLVMRVFGFPAVWYSGLQWGAQDAWLSFYLDTEEDNWVLPPWNYSDNAAAIMNVPCLIGAVIGCVYGGWFSDYFILWVARRRGGVSEAEDRLWLLIPAAIISPAGLLLFGIGSGKGWDWPWPYVGLGMIGFGWGCAGDLSMAYLQDAYPEMVLEGMVGVSVINNTIGCVFTFVADIWETAQGSIKVYVTIGVMSFVFMMTTVPMIYWGKSTRRWTESRYRNFVRLRDSA